MTYESIAVTMVINADMCQNLIIIIYYYLKFIITSNNIWI
jgi:hypothetical protein